MQLYTNEFTAELKAEIDRSPFTYEELAVMPEDARAIIAEQEAFHRQHPVTAIWRIATAGSQTRLGGVVLPVDREATMLMDDGSYTSVIVEGDCVAYPDGTLATIMTSAGEAFSWRHQGVALVGSLLDNDDEIISTPLGSTYLVTREGIPPQEDFLTWPGE
ncbi:hypothetical protein ACLE1M_002925 [Enterobacter hormaechei]|uniref:hypothetical protein n=1 Tax=Enterobacter hormaechei TaxID=158836 RepID=UPI0032B0930F